MVIEALSKIQAKEDMTQSNLKKSARLAGAARFIKQSQSQSETWQEIRFETL
jgi:hypothetical protein